MIGKHENLPLKRAFERLGELMPSADATTLIEHVQAGMATEAEWEGAAEFLLRNDPPTAPALLEAAVEALPESATLQYLLGNALRMNARPAEAEAALRKAISLKPGHAEASNSLAHLLREQGRMQALAEVMLAAWRDQPRSLANDQRILAFLCECERFADADSLVPAMLATHPQDAFLLRRAGEIALVLGRFDVARKNLRASLEVDANQASAWLRLAHTHRFSDADDVDLLLLEAASNRSDLNLDASTSIGFGLGKALDDLGRFKEAAEILTRANADWRNAHPWDASAWQAFVTAHVNAPIPVHAGSDADKDITPIFIVGLPRSGTTLVESLLTRDSQVRGRGELNWIAALARQLGANASPSMLVAAANFFLTQLCQDDSPPRFIIDKNPLNFRHLGLISAMLPKAKIIHCRRNLRDTALSLWSQHFAHEDLAWAYDFSDIETYTRGHEALMAHWQEKLPNSVFTLDYEALVADPETMIERAEAFLGLETKSAHSAHESSINAIATASVWQARQTIHQKSVSRWRHYQAHLPGLVDIHDR